MENQYSLLTEPWIPIPGRSRVGLRQIFTEQDLPGFGGDAVEKIAIFKLLMAIAQAAVTPQNEMAWRQLSVESFAALCLEYLEKWKDRFYLFGEKPFLQFPEVKKARHQNLGALLPEIATGNTTISFHCQQEASLSPGDMALLLLRNMSFSFSGKKADSKFVLTPGYVKKSAKPGPGIAYMGLLHSFFCDETVLDTLRLNLLTNEQIQASNQYKTGLGTPPWERMPTGEADTIAEELKLSLMGRLIPLSRFCLFDGNKIHYTEGLQHPDYNDGFWDPTAAINTSKKKARALWVDTEKRPWRQLTALLRFITAASDSFNCLQLQSVLPRIKEYNGVQLWSGGLRVSSNAGEQYVSGTDDFIDSVIELDPSMLNELWFNRLETEMSELETLGKRIYGCITGYYSTLTTDGKAFAAKGSSLFWQLAEKEFAGLIEACNANDHIKQLADIRRKFAGFVHQIYNQSCPAQTARQLDAWAKSRPNLSKYLTTEKP